MNGTDLDAPLVSIIMPMYNAEQFVEHAIQSVLKQTHDNWELIVVNDGSTDQSASRVSGFSDRRIQLIDQRNLGVSSARNRALLEATGKYIAFLDADDWLPPRSIQARLEVFEANTSATFVDGKVWSFEDSTNQKLNYWVPQMKGAPLEDLITIEGKAFWGPSWMIKASELTSKFDVSLSHGEDLWFFMELALSPAAYYDFTEEDVLFHRVGHGSAMTNLKGLEKGYHGIYQRLQQKESTNIQVKQFRSKARSIMIKSYLSKLQIWDALKLMWTKW